MIIRTDRMGDVILSTPVLTAVKKKYPQAKTTMLVSGYTVDVVSGHPDLDHVMVDDPEGEHKGFRGLLKLAKSLRTARFDAVLVLHPTSRLAWLCFLAGIPLRVGTGYRAYSILFNRRVFQHRKKSGRHELELNLDLAQAIGAPLKEIEFKFHIPQESSVRIDQWLTEQNLNGKHFIVLHPGSGGSALDWPLEYFGDLANQLQKKHGLPVVVTGSGKEAPLIDELSKLAPKIIRADGQFSIKELAALLKKADVMLANSTGPLHLAVAVGTRVVGLYCTLPACHPDRWGPYSSTATVLTPPADADYNSDQNPMRLLPVDKVLKAIIK